MTRARQERRQTGVTVNRTTADEVDRVLSLPPSLLIPPDVWLYIDQALDADADRPLAVFDADGTLWSGDVGETLLQAIDELGAINASFGYRSLLEEYDARCATDATAGYTWACTIMAGLEESTLKDICDQAWRQHRQHVLPGMRQLVQTMLAADVHVVVVSASSRWIIQTAVQELGISADDVIAFDQEVANGRLTSSLKYPLPNGQGKADAISLILGRRPCIGFGNSVHDLPMLRCSTHAVVVLAETDGDAFDDHLVTECETHGWERMRLG